jgi:hypothetical protein
MQNQLARLARISKMHFKALTLHLDQKKKIC